MRLGFTGLKLLVITLPFGALPTDFIWKLYFVPITVQSFTPIEVLYEALCSSDNIRMTKTYRLSGVCLDPISQRKLCLLMSTGRCLFYELLVSNSKEPYDNSLQNRLTLSGCVETKTDHFYPIQNPVGKLK